jgi:hypothetical protein
MAEETATFAHQLNLRSDVDNRAEFRSGGTNALTGHRRQESMKVSPTSAHDDFHAIGQGKLMERLGHFNITIDIPESRVEGFTLPEINVSVFQVDDVVTGLDRRPRE